jgi:hypothetical protein
MQLGQKIEDGVEVLKLQELAAVKNKTLFKE